MEYERPQPDTPESKDKKSEKKSRKRRGFWPPWLTRLSKDGEEGPAYEEAAEEEAGKPAKGFMEAFKKLFGRQVEAHPVEHIDEPETDVAEAAPDYPESPFRWPETVEAADEPEVRSVPEVRTDNVSAPEKDPKDKEAGVLRVRHDEEPVAPEFPSPIIPTAPELHRLNTEPVASTTQVSSEQVPNRSEMVKSPDKTGKNSEPLAAVTLVGLGAEYVARKRENRKQDKRIESLDRKLSQQSKETDRIAAIKPAAPERTVRGADRMPRSSAERAFIFTDQDTEMVQKKATGPEKIMPKPEAKTAPVANREKIAEEVAKKVEEYERLHKAPTAVLKEMLTAAEVNAPVEKIYERRQEVRDEPSNSQAHGAVPVGTILHGMKTTPQTAGTIPAAASLRKEDRVSDTANLIYKQAAQRGFWGAIVILIFALMVYLLS